MQYLTIAGNRVCDDTQRPRECYPGGPIIRVEIYKSWGTNNFLAKFQRQGIH